MGNVHDACKPEARDGGLQSGVSSEEIFPEYDENTINRGTFGRPRPQLKFHSVCGTNISLHKEGRVARRRESFCKGLAFSNRPISVGEIVCIRLCEVGTNWSGVMRFGVTNVDPASFRDIELPKFACPDLTSKGGYWAKSMAERYSIQNLILHFFVNENGEMQYGVTDPRNQFCTHKGLFLSGINVSSPLWTIIDIYGNSIAVEFIDPAEIQFQRRALSHSQVSSSSIIEPSAFPDSSQENMSARSRLPQRLQNHIVMNSSNSCNTLHNSGNSSRTPSLRASSTKLRFHVIKGNNVVLQSDNSVALRKHGEYYLGYVFTERPIIIDEKFVILVSMTEEAYSGSLAFGLTSCDPVKLDASCLPADSDELLERSEYWVCIKDVGAMPQAGATLTFQIDARGRVLFSKNNVPFRVIMHVDVTVPLWAFFDLYGSTRKIQLLDQSLNRQELAVRACRASSEGASDENKIPQEEQLIPSASLNRPSSAQWNLDSLRVALPLESTMSCATPPTHTVSAQTNHALNSLTPSSSTPSSFHSGIDAKESAKIRAENLLHRLNQQQRAINDNLSEIVARVDSTITETALQSASNEISPRIEDPPIPTSSTGPYAYASPTLRELLNRRHQQRELNRSSLSPVSSVDLAGAALDSSVRTEIYGYSNVDRENFATSITVPLLPPPLLSSLDIPSSNEIRGEQQNLQNRAAEFEAALYLGLRYDQSPIQQSVKNAEKLSLLEKADNTASMPNIDVDRGTECSICMNNRINAVIYRCGHMCMCFPCAKETHRRSGDCPICRTPIIDVIRCYPA